MQDKMERRLRKWKLKRAGSAVKIQNKFLAMMKPPEDVAANENGVSLVGNGFTDSDSLADQTLLYLDASAGYWWYQSTDDSGLTGLASVLELHYTTTLNDADTAGVSSRDE